LFRATRLLPRFNLPAPFYQFNPQQAQALLKEAGHENARVRDQVTWLYIGWPQACTVTQPWLHGHTNNLYAYLFCYGVNNFRSVWIDSNAPGGRGGKPI